MIAGAILAGCLTSMCPIYEAEIAFCYREANGRVECAANTWETDSRRDCEALLNDVQSNVERILRANGSTLVSMRRHCRYTTEA